jgi:ABC-type multidrug transport system permease subunit
MPNSVSNQVTPPQLGKRLVFMYLDIALPFGIFGVIVYFLSGYLYCRFWRGHEWEYEEFAHLLTTCRHCGFEKAED